MPTKPERMIAYLLLLAKRPNHTFLKPADTTCTIGVSRVLGVSTEAAAQLLTLASKQGLDESDGARGRAATYRRLTDEGIAFLAKHGHPVDDQPAAQPPPAPDPPAPPPAEAPPASDSAAPRRRTSRPQPAAATARQPTSPIAVAEPDPDPAAQAVSDAADDEIGDDDAEDEAPEPGEVEAEDDQGGRDKIKGASAAEDLLFARRALAVQERQVAELRRQLAELTDPDRDDRATIARQARQLAERDTEIQKLGRRIAQQNAAFEEVSRNLEAETARNATLLARNKELRGQLDALREAQTKPVGRGRTK
jgi:hypothetical protein